jgi:hypothetical protein
MPKQKKQKQPGAMIRIYAEDAAFLDKLKDSAEITADIGVPYIRPTAALAVHYLVKNARCPECDRPLPRGRCTHCDKAGM